MSFGKTNYRVGGTRGGADQFKWEDVKNDKYRENYLGHSVQAPVGRWQKGKDLTWYAKASKSERAVALQSELALAKQRDEDLMNEALGIAPRKRPEPVGGLDAAEMKELLKRGEAERDGMNVERVEGLGAAPVEASGFESGPKKTLAERYKEQLASGKADDTYALPGTVGDRGEGDSKAARKEARKAEKAAKKLKRKERKKEKKAKRHHARGDEIEDDAASRRRSCSRSPARERRRGRSRSRSRDGHRDYPASPKRRRSPEPSRRRSRSPRSPVRQRQRRHHRALSRSRSPVPRRRHARSSSRSRSRRRY